MAVMLDMYDAKNATAVVMEVTSMESDARARHAETSFSNPSDVPRQLLETPTFDPGEDFDDDADSLACSVHALTMMKESSAPTPTAMMAARMFMKGKNSILRTKV